MPEDGARTTLRIEDYRQPKPTLAFYARLVTDHGDVVTSITRGWGVPGKPPGCRLCPHHECSAKLGVCNLLVEADVPAEAVPYFVRPAPR